MENKEAAMYPSLVGRGLKRVCVAKLMGTSVVCCSLVAAGVVCLHTGN